MVTTGAWRAAVALFALAAIGAHVVELVRLVAEQLDRGPEGSSADVAFEAKLRRELREIGGLGPDTIDTVLAAARAPSR